MERISHGYNKLWQRNYYDHVIRNQHSYDYIANYIFTNPQRWKYDKLNSDCVEDSDDVNAEIKGWNDYLSGVWVHVRDMFRGMFCVMFRAHTEVRPYDELIFSISISL